MERITVIDDLEFRQDMRTKSLADRIGSTLATTYPGYRWRVDIGGGIADIRCEHATGKAGYTFNLVKNGLPSNKDVVMAGGEILESFALSRRALDVAEFLSKPRYLGNLVMVR